MNGMKRKENIHLYYLTSTTDPTRHRHYHKRMSLIAFLPDECTVTNVWEAKDEATWVMCQTKRGKIVLGILIVVVIIAAIVAFFTKFPVSLTLIGSVLSIALLCGYFLWFVPLWASKEWKQYEIGKSNAIKANPGMTSKDFISLGQTERMTNAMQRSATADATSFGLGALVGRQL